MPGNIRYRSKIEKVKRVYAAASLPEAHLLLHTLQANDIAARIFNENAQGGVGELPFTHAYPEVWIEHTDDEEEALRLVREFDIQVSVEGSLACEKCGEVNPPTFEICWSCASPLTGDEQ